MRSMTIGQVARATGLRASAIRYYERAGILATANRVSGQRRYDERILKLLAVVSLAREAGFSIEEIRVLFRDFSPETVASKRWRKLAAAKLEELDETLRRTKLMRDIVLGAMECRCETLEDCGTVMLRSKSPRPGSRV